MAFAPYMNIHRNADQPAILGQFIEEDAGHYFEFSARTEADRASFASDFPHRVFVGPAGEESRCARVLKTVAYIVVDEGPDGEPITEKWSIKAKRDYAPA